MMQAATTKAAFGALVHRLDELSCRARLSGSVLSGQLPEPELRACAANRPPRQNGAGQALLLLARAADRTVLPQRSAPGLDPYTPLDSVFNHLRGNRADRIVPPEPAQGRIPYPEAPSRLTPAIYGRVAERIRQGLQGLQPDEQGLNTLLLLLEETASRIPADPAAARPDTSWFDYARLKAAVACCIQLYLQAKGSDPAAALADDGEQFQDEQAFLLYTADLSGIQAFLYTVASSGALRSLRSRSFYLELLMEHIIDEVLTACGLTRINRVYSGGGHCYLLLPNTPDVVQAIRSVMESVAAYLLQNFGTQLYLAYASVSCSANDLNNVPAQQEPYQQLYRTLSHRISQQKLRRYTADQLRALNSAPAALDGRECRICGTSRRLNPAGYCAWCQRFADLSRPIQERDVYIVSRQPREGSMELPSPAGPCYLSFADSAEAWHRMDSGEELVRLYIKNRRDPALPGAIRLYVGDYHSSNNVNDLVASAKGIARLAVCRADVDNLGAAFVNGFEDPEAPPQQRSRYVNLIRTAALSRQLSLFFQYHINAVLDGSQPDMPGELPVTIVYSGGDDVFLIGAWNGVLEGMERIRNAFRRFCCESLSISAGICLRDSTYPLRMSALETEALEADAKSLPGKDAVSLFEAESGHTYHWQEFEERVRGEKLACIQRFYQNQPDSDARGTSFLFNLLQLLQNSTEQINTARFAYLLARMEPSRRNQEQYEAYRELSRNFFRWYRAPEDRRELITAIYLYFYQIRKKGQKDE